MGLIANLNRRLRFGGLEGSELRNILQIGTTSPKWPALFALLNHPYWKRSWIIQQIAVAERVNIFYGNAILAWHYFASTIEMLHDQNVGSLFIISSDVAPPRTMPFRIRSISRIRSKIEQQSCMELIELLYYSAKSDATFPKDKLCSGWQIQQPNLPFRECIFGKCKIYSSPQHTSCFLSEIRCGYCIMQALVTQERLLVFLRG
jgi:hypothetical protein